MPKFDNLPERMKDLPIDERGYPIPYFAATINGKRDLKFSDQKKKEICRKYKKCWVCGHRLLFEGFWVITGPLGLANRTVSDEPMHEECARFALGACPHMYYEKAERVTDRMDLPPVPSHAPGKPSELYLIHADKIWYGDALHTHFRVVSVERYGYENGKLAINVLH